MDTGSHLLFGLTLAGLAHLDPAVAGDPVLSGAVLAGTMVGSNAPDTDAVMRLKSYSSYIRHHRGITHSFPAWCIWPSIITGLLAGVYQLDGSQSLHLLLWTLTGVLFHVFLDLLNTYGIQIGRPFSAKWYHLDILPIFDPFLFLLHTAGGCLWLAGGDPGSVFACVYSVTAIHIGWRILHHRIIVRRVRRTIAIHGNFLVSPCFHWFRWLFIVETEKGFYTGRVRGREAFVEDVYGKTEQDPVIRASMETDGVRAFLGFAQWIHVTREKIRDGYEVRWSDVRFWYNRTLPFGADVRLDRDLNVVSQKLGWRKKAWDPPFV